MRTAQSQALSLGLHALFGLLLLALLRTAPPPVPSITAVHLMPLIVYHPAKVTEERAGGSNQSPLPAKQGSPPPGAYRTFIPPASADHPSLPVPITISFDIPTEDDNVNIGDPLSRLLQGGFGRNGSNGIGDHGCCGGIGGSRSGSPGLAVSRERGVTPPQLIYKVEPEFSEEARKAKLQGVVVLVIEVDAGGSVRDVRVRQSLGLGLDEKAVEAVSH